jgi:hypothetical protein
MNDPLRKDKDHDNPDPDHKHADCEIIISVIVYIHILPWVFHDADYSEEKIQDYPCYQDRAAYTIYFLSILPVEKSDEHIKLRDHCRVHHKEARDPVFCQDNTTYGKGG